MSKSGRVLQHHYNALTQRWTKVQSEISMEEKPFAEGAFRAAYAAEMTWGDQQQQTQKIKFVCKFAKDPSTHKSMYFNDVEAHEIATLYAKKFNDHLPSQYPRIGYVPAFVVEFVDRPGRPVCGCEQLLDGGKFKKYNNNVGAVCAMSSEEQAELARTTQLENWDPTSTAQAFSHFSWEHSSNQVLICDIQGVENRFTDPQIHTLSGKGFGLGNLGQTGIRAFLLRHTCTDLCRAVGLSPIKAKDLNERQVQAFLAQAQQNNLHHGLPMGAQQSASSGNNNYPNPNLMPQPKRAQHGGHHSNSNGGGSNGGGSDVLILGDDRPVQAASSGQQQRGLSSSASTAYISHQASQAVMRQQPGQHQQHQQQQFSQHQSRDRPTQQNLSVQPSAASTHSARNSRQSSTQSTPAHSPSPSSSPKASSVNGGFGTPKRTSQQPAAAPSVPNPSPKKATLDDSDEALMASIMGD